MKNGKLFKLLELTTDHSRTENFKMDIIKMSNIQYELGEGASGKVMLAMHKRTGKEVYKIH